MTDRSEFPRKAGQSTVTDSPGSRTFSSGRRSLIQGALFSPLMLVNRHLAGEVGPERPLSSEDLDVPNAQLTYITPVPPSMWELEGCLAAVDFAKLLLRRGGQPGWDRRQTFKSSTRQYATEDFDRLSSPDVIGLELNEGSMEVLQAPESIIMMAESGEGRYGLGLYGYLLPLLVKNNSLQMKQFKVQTPFQDYVFTVPRSAVRGFCLNITDGQIGRRTAEFLFEVDGLTRKLAIPLDVRATGTLRIRLLDADGTAVTARVYLTGSDGLAHMPVGGVPHISLINGEYFFYPKIALQDGSFKILLPEGETTIEAVRGMEYEPVRKRVRVVANQTQSLDLELNHRLPMCEKGWYSCDSHIHANYINDEVVDAEGIDLQVSGEGLDVANCLVANSYGALIHDERFFEGKPNRLSQGHKIIYWNQEIRNRNRLPTLYGHMYLFNLKTLVHPMLTGCPGTTNFEDYPPNYTQAAQAKAQNAIVAYSHPLDPPDFKGGCAPEFPIDLALGVVDALSLGHIMGSVRPNMELWYRALNCGFRCAICAETDSTGNWMRCPTLGANRFYVYVPGDFSYDKWVEAFRKGKTFATDGPMLDFTANGQGPGEELRFPEGKPVSVKIKAGAQSVAPMDKLEIVRNGSVVASQEATGARTEITIEKEISFDRSSWIAARVFGPGNRLVLNELEAFAHSSPVYCYLGQEPIASAADAAFWVDWIEQVIGEVKAQGVFSKDERRDSVIQLFRKAQDIYKRMNSR